MPAPNDVAASALYRAVWRWHFIAGLIVLPVLVLLAVTGGLYLFKPELDHLAYRRLEDVPARAAPLAPPSLVIARVEAATPGKVLQFTPATAYDQAVRLMVRADDGKALTAFADPYDGRLIGTTSYGGVMQLVRKVHSLQKFGFWASCIVEIAAGWAVVMVATGLVLWWPRGRPGGVVSVRGAPGQRVFWRDLHAVTGAFSAAVILFLAVTGMPWSMVWGDHVQRWATARNLYEPKAPARVTPGWMLAMDMPATKAAPPARADEAKPDRPWALEKAPMPMSMPMAAPMTGRTGIGVDGAVARFAQLGLPRPYSVTLPQGPDGAFVADYRPDRVEDSRTLYLDQYSRRVLGDVGFRQWGPAAKAIEWGIAVHQGQEYGPLNRYLMLAGCVAILLLAVSAVIMWWKRRPSGGLGVPPAPSDRRVAAAVLGVVAVVGVIYPLVGATLVAALAVDALIARLPRPRLAAAA
jgi:uncharacterized iron-regulated membrane protein